MSESAAHTLTNVDASRRPSESQTHQNRNSLKQFVVKTGSKTLAKSVVEMSSEESEEISDDDQMQEHPEQLPKTIAEEMKAVASSFYKSDPYFGHEPISFKEPEDGWKSISKVILTRFAPKNKVYDYEKFLPVHVQKRMGKSHKKQKHSEEKVKKFVNFLDPKDLLTSVKHLNETVINNSEDRPLRSSWEREQLKFRRTEELRHGLNQRRKDILLAALNQPFTTNKFREVMNQVNRLSQSPSKLNDSDELKDYNHVIKAQKRIIANAVKPKIKDNGEKVAIVDGSKRENVIPVDRELIILENEENNTHYEVKAELAQDFDKQNVPQRNIKSDVSIEFSGMLDDMSELMELLESPFGKPQSKSRENWYSSTSKLKFGAGQSSVADRSGMSMERVRNQKLPRYRRKSDTSQFSGGECKKLTAVSHIVLPTDIKTFSVTNESPERAVSRSTSRQKSRKERGTKANLNFDGKGRVEPVSPTKLLEEPENYEDASPTNQASPSHKSEERQSTRKSVSTAPKVVRVLSTNNKPRKSHFVPISKKESSNFAKKCDETGSPRRRAEGDASLIWGKEKIILERRTSEPLISKSEKKKELKAALDIVKKLNGKAKHTLFRDTSSSLSSQKFPTLRKNSSGAIAQDTKQKTKTGFDLNRRANSVDINRKYSFEHMGIAREEKPVPYLTHLPFNRPAHSTTKAPFEKFEVGVGPKKGPFDKDFKYERRSQSSVKIRRTGSNFYIRT